MKYGPGGTVPTVNVNGLKTPLALKAHVWTDVSMAGVELESGPQPAKLPKSADAKPLPETVTTVPTGPEDGFSVIVGPVTVKTA
jgi:hypothetical protein